MISVDILLPHLDPPIHTFKILTYKVLPPGLISLATESKVARLSQTLTATSSEFSRARSDLGS